MSNDYEILKCNDATSWHAKRMISGTVISAIMGRHKYVSRFKAYQELTGTCDPFTGSYQTRRGEALEPVVAEEAMDLIGMKFSPCGMTVYRSKDRPWETVTPDYVNHDEQLGMEIKTHGSKMANILGQGPMDHQVDQCQWAMAILGWRMWYLVIAVDDDDPRIVPIERDEEWIKSARQAAHDFYHDHILTKTPPPADASDDYKAHLEDLYPHGEGEKTLSDREKEHLQMLIANYEAASREIGQWEEVKKRNGNMIREVLGEFKYANTDLGKVSWYDRKASTPWKRVAEELRAHVDDNLWKQVMAGVTNTSKPIRVLRVAYSGE